MVCGSSPHVIAARPKAACDNTQYDQEMHVSRFRGAFPGSVFSLLLWHRRFCPLC